MDKLIMLYRGLRYYLKEIPSELAPELKSHFLQIEINRKLKKAS